MFVKRFVLRFYLFYVYGCLAHRSVNHLHVVPLEAIRGRQIPIGWSYIEEVVSCPDMVLGTELRSPGRAGIAFNRRVISLTFTYIAILKRYSIFK